MNIYPAIDLYDGKAVRLLKGDYSKMNVYSCAPIAIARDFESKGAKFIHVVDLEGAKTGGTPNMKIVESIASETNLFIEVGGGIRDMSTIKKYFACGADRVILGTSAVTDSELLFSAISAYKEKIAVGADIKDGYIAIKGWIEKSQYPADVFFEKMQNAGIKTIICTDISRDGAMMGVNSELYAALAEKYTVNIIASGGVSAIDDIKALRAMNLYGAIIGKAYYTGAIDLKEAIEVAK